MATKRMTRKEQKIADEMSALSDRLFDMLVGAAGGCSLQETSEDDDWFVTASVGLEEMAGWMKAARNYLDFVRTEGWPQSWTDEELKDRALHVDNLRHFDTVRTAAKHLYSYGFRAEAR